MGNGLILKDGARVAVIGGGPAGSFFAHFILKLAEKNGLSITATIFDGKDFLQRGPRGCNLCAGVIAESLNRKLQEEGIFLPEKRIINRVDGYCLHVDGETLDLSCADNRKNTIATVFRGNGPRFSTFPDIISFDDFLLGWAEDRGARVAPWPVWDIRLPGERNAPVVIRFGRKDNLQEFEADLVAGAFGVNSYLLKKMDELGFGYRPPSTLITYQAELNLGREEIHRHFGNSIHVYMPKSQSLRYATVIPKGDYLTVTLIGRRDATRDMLEEFLRIEGIRGKLPSMKPQCFCFPRIAVSPSRRPFTDRLVMVGDASFSRHYKNGLESAFDTARLAADAVFISGIDASSFARHYYRRAKKLIVRDNSYGRILFLMNDLISSLPLLARSHMSLTRETNNGTASAKLRSVLWNMFTGNISYQEIFRTALDLKLQISLLFHTTGLLFQKIKAALGRPN